MAGSLFGSMPIASVEPFTARVFTQSCEVYYVGKSEINKLPRTLVGKIQAYLTHVTTWRLNGFSRQRSALENGLQNEPVAETPLNDELWSDPVGTIKRAQYKPCSSATNLTDRSARAHSGGCPVFAEAFGVGKRKKKAVVPVPPPSNTATTMRRGPQSFAMSRSASASMIAAF
jgi:hypothetical protein